MLPQKTIGTLARHSSLINSHRKTVLLGVMQYITALLGLVLEAHHG